MPPKLSMYMVWQERSHIQNPKHHIQTRENCKFQILPVCFSDGLKEYIFQKYSKDVIKIIQKSLKSGIDKVDTQKNEYKILKESQEFLEKEFKASLCVEKAEDSKENKAKQALPGKAAILVE